MYLIPKNFPGQLPSELVPVVANIALVSLSQGCKYYFSFKGEVAITYAR